MRAVWARIGATARTLTWPFRTPLRMLALAWLVALAIVGSANNALAAGVDDGGLFVGPDLGNTGGETFFERFDSSAFTYPVDTDSDHDGLESQVWNIANGIANFLTWLGMSVLRGALVALQWMLNLDLYADQSAAVDRAMSELNTGVFLPLLVISLGIGAAVAFSRGRTSGGGTFIGDMIWLVAASVLAITFVAGPSKVLDTFDTARSSIAAATTSSYAAAAGTTTSATGYPTPDTGDDTNGAVRQLTDSLWNVYGVSGWCYTAWKSTDACAVVGQQYLEDPDADSGPWGDARSALEDDGNVEPFGDDTDWVRGQEWGRVGAALMMAGLSIGAGVMLLAMTVFGLMALIGLIILIFLGVFFLATWMIPGRPRQIGVKWLEALIGTFLQTLFITSILGAVMVVGALFNAASATYGIFMVAVFNGTALLLGLRFRGQIEQMLGFGTSATGTSMVSGYLAARAITGGARMGRRAIGGGARAGAKAVGSTAPVVGGAVAGGARAVPAAGRRIAQKVAPLRTAHIATAPQAGPAKTSSTATSSTSAPTTTGASSSAPAVAPNASAGSMATSSTGGRRKPPPPSSGSTGAVVTAAQRQAPATRPAPSTTGDGGRTRGSGPSAPVTPTAPAQSSAPTSVSGPRPGQPTRSQARPAPTPPAAPNTPRVAGSRRQYRMASLPPKGRRS